MRFVVGSITGVLVIPVDGEMSPHGGSGEGSGVARCPDHATEPVDAFNAYTVSFSVATYTFAPNTSGCAYTSPSSGVVCHACDGVTGSALSGSIPLRAASCRYVVHAGAAAPAPAVVAASTAMATVTHGNRSRGRISASTVPAFGRSARWRRSLIDAAADPPPAANHAARSADECGSSRGAAGGGLVAVPVCPIGAMPIRATVQSPSRSVATQVAWGSAARRRSTSIIASSL